MFSASETTDLITTTDAKLLTDRYVGENGLKQKNNNIYF